MIVNEEQEEMAARLDLFLPNEFVKLEFEFGVGDINYGELLSVITGRCVTYCIKDETHVVIADVFTFVTSYAAPLEQGFFYTFHV